MYTKTTLLCFKIIYYILYCISYYILVFFDSNIQYYKHLTTDYIMFIIFSLSTKTRIRRLNTEGHPLEKKCTQKESN